MLGLVLVILAFGPVAMGGVRTWQFLVLQGLTLGVMALWAARLWASPRPRLLWPPICWAVVAFVVYAIIRYLQADIELVARRELVRVLVYAFLFFAILNNLQRQEHALIIIATLVFLGMAISFYAGYQFLTKSQRVWNVVAQYPGRGSGTFIYPNNLAGFLEMLAPLGLCYALMGRLSYVMKILLGYASAVMLAGLAVTFSRGGYAAAGLALAGLCVTLFFQRGYRIHALVLTLALAAACIFAVPQARMAQQRFQQLFSARTPDDLRLTIWAGAITMWREHFWLGAGPGHFDYRFRQYRPVAVQMRPLWAHNDYLNTLADWGVAGAALVASAWVLLYWGVVRSWKFVRGARDDFSRKKSNKVAFLIGASLGLAAILAHSATDFNMQIPANAILAVALMALLSAQQRLATESPRAVLGAASKYAAAAVLLAGICFLGWMGCRSAREDFWRQRAAAAPAFSNARIAALKKAFEAEPENFETTYAIGECYRVKSFNGETDEPEALAKEALGWYQRGMKLNPYDGYNWLRYGMCLDMFSPGEEGPQEDSGPYYKHADELDPNGYYTSANIGWHYLQTGDYAASRSWLERSRQLEWTDANEIALDSLPIVEQLLKEAAEKSQ